MSLPRSARQGAVARARHRGAAAVALALAVLAAVATPTSAATQAPTSRNTLVTRTGLPTTSYEAPILAAAGSRIALATSDYQRKSCELWTSSDEGGQWTRRGAVGAEGYVDCSVTSGAAVLGPRGLAMSARGTVLYSFRAATKASEDAQADMVVRSPDGGGHFTSSFRSPGSNTQVALGAAGTAYAAWSAGGALMVAGSRDDGRTFAAPAVAVPSSLKPGVGRGWLQVGPRGEVYVFYTDASQTEPALGFGLNKISVARSTDQGRSWMQLVITTSPVTGALSRPRPVGTVDPSTGALGVVWSDTRNGPLLVTGTDRDVFFARSGDGGATWTAVRRLNDDPLGSGDTQYQPWVSSTRGRMVAAWYDYRQDPAGGVGPQTTDSAGLPDVYAASSPDAGRSFGANRRVTDRSIDRFIGLWSNNFVQAPVAVVGSPSGAVLAWSDTRRGSVESDAQDIYAVRLRSDGRGAASTERTALGDAPSALSRLAFPAGGTVGQADGSPVGPTVVVAPAADISTAVVAAALARDRGASLLFADARGLSPSAVAEVRRLRARRAYLVGDASTDGVAAALTQAGVTEVNRVAGTDPADTARQVAAISTPPQGYHPLGDAGSGNTAVVVMAPGPLPAGPSLVPAAAGIAPALDLPVLLVTAAGVPAATTRAIREQNIQHTLVIASAAQLPDAVLSQLPDPRRLSGPDLASTSSVVADELLRRGGPATVAYLAATAQPEAAIAAGVVAGRLGGVLLLTPCSGLRAGATAWTRRHTASLDRLVVAGAC